MVFSRYHLRRVWRDLKFPWEETYTYLPGLLLDRGHCFEFRSFLLQNIGGAPCGVRELFMNNQT